jgi:hypothetical protein
MGTYKPEVNILRLGLLSAHKLLWLNAIHIETFTMLTVILLGYSSIPLTSL